MCTWAGTAWSPASSRRATAQEAAVCRPDSAPRWCPATGFSRLHQPSLMLQGPEDPRNRKKGSQEVNHLPKRQTESFGYFFFFFFLQGSNIISSTKTMHQTALLTYLQISPVLLYSLESCSFPETPELIQQLGGCAGIISTSEH